MTPVRLKITDAQWKDVSKLVLAMSHFERAGAEMERMRKVFGIPPGAALNVDLDGGEIMYYTRGPEVPNGAPG